MTQQLSQRPSPLPLPLVAQPPQSAILPGGALQICTEAYLRAGLGRKS